MGIEPATIEMTKEPTDAVNLLDFLYPTLHAKAETTKARVERLNLKSSADCSTIYDVNITTNKQKSCISSGRLGELKYSSSRRTK